MGPLRPPKPSAPSWEQQGLSQEVLADRAGVHWTFLGQVERGQRSIRLDNILKIARGLDVRPGELLDELPAPG